VGRRLSTLAALRDLVTPLLARLDRVLLGIAGPPGAGKSTAAQALTESLSKAWDDGTGVPFAVTVPMDGFHLSNVELGRLGLADRKGAPETFDPAGLAHLLCRIRAREDLVYAPAYSRSVHESLGGVIPVPAATRLVVVEGNYLLLRDDHWAALAGLFDLTVYLDADPVERVAGLVERQLSFGLSEPEALDWVYRSDEANARRVEASRPYADVVLTR
jgi:pantothenate kinase